MGWLAWCQQTVTGQCELVGPVSTDCERGSGGLVGPVSTDCDRSVWAGGPGVNRL